MAATTVIFRIDCLWHLRRLCSRGLSELFFSLLGVLRLSVPERTPERQIFLHATPDSVKARFCAIVRSLGSIGDSWLNLSCYLCDSIIISTYE